MLALSHRSDRIYMENERYHMVVLRVSEAMVVFFMGEFDFSRFPLLHFLSLSFNRFA